MTPVIYEHPLAYLLGLEGIALLRSFTGEGGREFGDREFVDSRIAEMRKLLHDESLAGAAVEVARVSTVDGYRIWSETYDGPNSAFAFDEPVVKEIVAELPKGVALDAACGTGRIGALLAEQGHQVIGVDSSPDMLARARERVPDGAFHLGDLHRLPVADDAVDLVVCCLALTHVPDLKLVMAEFARVLRPGGHLVIADMHPEWVARGSIPPVRLPDGRPGRLETYRHPTGDYLRAALPVGLQVRRCEEPVEPAGKRSQAEDPPRARMTELGPWELWPWCLADLVPEAAGAANAGVPAVIIWHFQLAGP
ncbi:class I SAM-dependent methyltransferase [Streptomyces jeddahensis]|uniref:Malonyl-[acyl-carrier protein] O-methyltransferase n=1 Tax=Streptomyces jeddahensis TaxID=1716141 RepID=A0A177HNP6_9ACTN|nr:class I SAM-dependent methyltransferase [Streptomyces jeddahensis]OAH12632.1 malonyl-[acyl-carrier protein] O-methyltransferase [Streptomyces jeddahensis]